MKFGKRIQAIMVPEWRIKYVNYKALKKSIKRAKIRALTTTTDHNDQSASYSDSCATAADFPEHEDNDFELQEHENPPVRHLQQNAAQQQAEQQRQHQEPNVQQVEQRRPSQHDESCVIELHDAVEYTQQHQNEQSESSSSSTTANTTKHSSGTVESVPSSPEQHHHQHQQGARTEKSCDEQPKDDTIIQVQVDEDADKEITSNKEEANNSEKNNTRMAYMDEQEALKEWSEYIFPSSSQEFTHLLLSELNKVNEFYERTEKRYATRQGQIHQQIDLYRKMRAKRGKGISKKKVALLTKVFQEHYRSLNLLLNYRVLNYTAAVKSVKKYQKNVPDAPIGILQEYITHLKKQYFYSSPILQALIVQVEYVFTNDIFKGDRKKAMNNLREQEKTRRDSKNEVFRMGLSFGVAIALTLYAIYYYFMEYPGYRYKKTRPSYSSSVFFGYRLTLLPIIMGLLGTLNMKIWNHVRINYVFIFQLNPREHLYPAQIAEMLFWLYNMTMFSLIGYMWSVVMEYRNIINFKGLAYIYPIINGGLIIVFWCLPVKWFYGKARFWLIHTLGRIAIAPFCAVKFKDFFIADQLTSLSNVLFEIQFVVCVYPVINSEGGKGFCDKYQGLGIPILNVLPMWSRFAQCLRRFRDSRWKQWNPHMINAGKYFFSILVAIMAFVDRAVFHYTSPMLWNPAKGFWFALAIISSLYSLLWDLIMDWGLMQSKYYMLRKDLLYPKWVYYSSMIADTLMRFFWVVPFLVKAYAAHATDPWLPFLFILVELVRRGMWNVIRLENEHLNNCGQFRAVTDVPLPFEVQEDDAKAISKTYKKNSPKSIVDRIVRFVSCGKLRLVDVFFCFSGSSESKDKDVRSDPIGDFGEEQINQEDDDDEEEEEERYSDQQREDRSEQHLPNRNETRVRIEDSRRRVRHVLSEHLDIQSTEDESHHSHKSHLESS